MLQIENIDVYYGKIQVLKQVSLDVQDGELVTLIGSNGAGKSTTLRAISGLLRPRVGRILYDGKPLHQLPAHEIVNLGVVQCPEGRRLFGHLSVTDNLRLGAVTPRSRSLYEKTKREVFELFPRLEERSKQSASTLSGGEQQMLAIGRALMAQPKLLLLDEPSLGLAPLLVESVFSIIKRIRAQGVTIMLVEQNAWQALAVADRGYVMETGSITLADSGAALLQNPEVERAYLGGVL